MSVEEMWQAEADQERETVAFVQAVFAQIADEMRFCWRFGDGDGGAVCLWVRDAVGIAPAQPEPRTKSKRRISRTLARRVMERDEYRCQACGGWHDLTIDHVLPESRGGTDDEENLQTLCRSCNSAKGVR